MSSESRLEWSVVGGWRFVGGERMEVRVWNFKMESDDDDDDEYIVGTCTNADRFETFFRKRTRKNRRRFVRIILLDTK